MAKIVVIDGQGGGFGRALIEKLRAGGYAGEVIAVGTNAAATAAMRKAGARDAATGENPVLVACRKADVILGPIGIVIADALLGEVTETMAAAVGRADAVRILLPMNRCENLVAGVPELTTAALIADALDKLAAVLD